MIVFQNAWRNGRKRVVGSGRRREARDWERRCWGMGRSVWKMPKRPGWKVSYCDFGLGAGK